jgi:hypothetical protein
MVPGSAREPRPESLFQAIGVPGQIVIHHQVSALKIDTLARCVGGEKDLYLGIVLEGLLSLHAILAAQGYFAGSCRRTIPLARGTSRV